MELKWYVLYIIDSLKYGYSLEETLKVVKSVIKNDYKELVRNVKRSIRKIRKEWN